MPIRARRRSQNVTDFPGPPREEPPLWSATWSPGWLLAPAPERSLWVYVNPERAAPSTFVLSCPGGWIGRRTEQHAVANGKVLLAHGAIPVPRSLERYTAQTIADHKAMRAELAAVRRNGYAKAVSELEEGLVAVASPVFDGTGACVAALSVSGPAFRMRPDPLDELGKVCAAQ